MVPEDAKRPKASEDERQGEAPGGAPRPVPARPLTLRPFVSRRGHLSDEKKWKD